MDECRLTRSPSISSFDTNHSSWSFVGEDDFDLLDEEEDDSASENEVEEEDDQVENVDDDYDDGDEDSIDDDDDISVVTEEDVLSDPSALAYTDVVKVSEQLDELSKCFDSPFNQIMEDFALERNIRFMAIISAAAIAMVTFYYAYGIGKPESLSYMSAENVCFVNEDRFLGLQYRDIAPSFLHPFFETLLKPSISVCSVLPSNIPKMHAIKPFSWIFNAEGISATQDKDGYFAKNQCERVSIEHQFSAKSETVRRYLRHTKKLKKPCNYYSLILPNISETLIDSRKDHDGKLQVDLQMVVIDSSENRNSMETESSGHSESVKIEISKFQKPLSIPKLILPIPTFSANHPLIKPKIGLLTSQVSSQELSAQRETTSVPESITDFERIEKKCFEAISSVKNIKSLEKKLQYYNDLSSLFADSKLRELKKLLESNSEEVRQSKKDKSKVLVISSVKKAISRTVKRTKAHRDKILEQLNRAVNNIPGKNRLKYINSLLDLSICTDLRLICEKYWWTKECCPKERCTFPPWQRHFNAKRFLASQGHKMYEAFKEVGWLIPEKKHKDSDGKVKFKFGRSSRSTGSAKEMRSRQNRKKSMESYSRKSGIQDRIH
ncbi:unnamed protein product [Cercopithifilaria johnstoni]|uniref:Uncharacterized protein n=1 Tax=Cercopithifilaria johnstoni TaxID=2874296 RepID=A0A8J2PWE7_9BILA|nr:unnamed protein product [Cercopithifilaria johnstoni]